MSALGGLDLSSFWVDSAYARRSYVEAPLTPAMVAQVEADLGVCLPAAYVELMGVQNGGFPRPCRFDITPSDPLGFIEITSVAGIGHSKPYSLCGASGSRFMQEGWGYPTWGVVVCTMPSAGHDVVMLDYRKNGPQGEPQVVHVDQESNYAETFLAETWAGFVLALKAEDDYIEAVAAANQAALEQALFFIDHGRFSTTLTRLLADPQTDWARLLRVRLRAIAEEKAYFALHGDDGSHTVYDILFHLAHRGGLARDSESFFKAYEKMLALCDGQINTGGYARGFLTGWLEARQAAGEIVKKTRGRLEPTEAFTARIGALTK